MISTDTNISGVGGHVALWWSLLQIFRGTFFELAVVETPELPLLSTLFIIVLDIRFVLLSCSRFLRVDAVASTVCKDV